MHPKAYISTGVVLVSIGAVKACVVADAIFIATSAYSFGYATGLLIASAIYVAGGMKLIGIGSTKQERTMRTGAA